LKAELDVLKKLIKNGSDGHKNIDVQTAK